MKKKKKKIFDFIKKKSWIKEVRSTARIKTNAPNQSEQILTNSENKASNRREITVLTIWGWFKGMVTILK